MGALTLLSAVALVLADGSRRVHGRVCRNHRHQSRACPYYLLSKPLHVVRLLVLKRYKRLQLRMQVRCELRLRVQLSEATYRRQHPKLASC